MSVSKSADNPSYNLKNASLLPLLVGCLFFFACASYPARISEVADIERTPSDYYSVNLVGLPISDYSGLGKFNALRDLTFPKGDTCADDEHLFALASVRGLKVRHVHLSGSALVTDAGVARLLSIISIQSLNLDGTAITDKTLALLRGNPRLVGLSVVGCREISFDGIVSVLSNPSLQHIGFSAKGFPVELVASLPSKFPAVNHWTIIDPELKLSKTLKKGRMPNGTIIDLRREQLFSEYP